MTPSLLTLSDPERSKSRSLSHNRTKLGPMLLLTIDRKPYMGSPMTPSIMIFNDLKGQSQGHLEFKALYLIKEQLGPMSLLTINRKPYVASPRAQSLLTLSDFERSEARSLGF